METLTPRQEAILEFVTEFLEKRRIPPTVREIQEHFEFESTNAAVEHLTALERKGYLKRRRGVSRGIELTSRSISFHPAVASLPLVGEIAAGTPLLAEENIEGYIHLDKTLIGGEGHFLLRVKGDSMRGAGICDGDLVVVKKAESAERGEIVAAYLGGEATVKYYNMSAPRGIKVRGIRRGEGRGAVELRPANPVYSPILITKEKYPDFRILGKVRAVLRVF
jgi:repressor LexA